MEKHLQILSNTLQMKKKSRIDQSQSNFTKYENMTIQFYLDEVLPSLKGFYTIQQLHSPSLSPCTSIVLHSKHFNDFSKIAINYCD